jgi:hypothetical protein
MPFRKSSTEKNDGLIHSQPRKEDVESQIIAFEAMVDLITCYPPMRRIFLWDESFRHAPDPQTTALETWKREDKVYDSKWTGFYQLAVASFSEEVDHILDDTPFSDWGEPSGRKLGVIDQLLIKLSSESAHPSLCITIAYLR